MDNDPQSGVLSWRIPFRCSVCQAEILALDVNIKINCECGEQYIISELEDGQPFISRNKR